VKCIGLFLFPAPEDPSMAAMMACFVDFDIAEKCNEDKSYVFKKEYCCVICGACSKIVAYGI
jgi:hypothetical protein